MSGGKATQYGVLSAWIRFLFQKIPPIRLLVIEFIGHREQALLMQIYEVLLAIYIGQIGLGSVI